MNKFPRPGLAARARCLSAASLMLLAPVAHAAKTPVYAITKAKVVTVSGAVIENATVVMRDGLLVDIGPAAVIPKDARVIDGTGLTLTPGLIDAYSGAGMPTAPRPTGGGGGGGGAAAAVPATPPANPINPASSIYERVRVADALRARDSGITTIVPIPRDGLVFGTASVMNLVGEKSEGMVVMPNVAFAASIATLRQAYPGSLMGTMAYFRQTLMDAAYHRSEVAAYEKSPVGKKRPAFDPGLDAWADVAAGKTPLLLQTPRVGDLRRAFALGDEFKLKLILAGNMRASDDLGFVKSRKPALLVSVNFDPARAGGGFGGPGGDDDKERADIESAETNPAALDKEGVKFALVSGFANDFLVGIRKAVEKGLPRDVALRAVTLTPAEILGVSDRMGSVEKGKIANVVLWSGDPLTRDAKIKMVFVDGELYEPEEKPAGPPGGGGGPRPGEEQGNAATIRVQNEVKR
ncbi:MAG: amidohydrolase family protein [Vicinamibacteria bacterium]